VLGLAKSRQQLANRCSAKTNRKYDESKSRDTACLLSQFTTRKVQLDLLVDLLKKDGESARATISRLERPFGPRSKARQKHSARSEIAGRESHCVHSVQSAVVC